ncbi:MBL fold metallo-hydrolase [Dehalococcoidia bacterium]|nr:MBL fold metallo-hydrolase [Dehalococcoidia bacterium]
MKIKILGAHGFESRNTRLSSILVDDILAVDAGGLTSSLSFAEQERVEFVLLTHGHYDHIRDVPAIALKNSHRTIEVFATESTHEILLTHLINGVLYPRFATWPSPESPVLRLHTLEPYRAQTVGVYHVLPVPVVHALSAVGYQITDGQGKSIFFSGDTGPGLSSCWEHITPQLLIMDMFFSNKSTAAAHKPGHLCPSLLRDELVGFRRINGYLPRVLLTHLNPEVEDEIRDEAAQLAKELGADISLAYEGREISL